MLNIICDSVSHISLVGTSTAGAFNTRDILKFVLYHERVCDVQIGYASFTFREQV